MSDVTAAHPLPLRPALGSDGMLCLTPADAVRVVLALKYLAALAHWSPAAKDWDDAIAEDAEWMAESLGDAVLVGRG